MNIYWKYPIILAIACNTRSQRNAKSNAEIGTKEKEPTSSVINCRELRIVLQRLENDVAPVESNENNDSNEQAENSVIFVDEKEASQDLKQIANLNKKIELLLTRNRKLKTHVEALQSRIRNAEDDVIEISDGDDDNNEHSLNNITLHESWVGNQINEWMDNGDLSLVCADFVQFLDENVSLSNDSENNEI